MARIVSKRYFGVMPVFNMEVKGLHNCRYYAISRTLAAEAKKKMDDFSDLVEDAETEYQEYMCGGVPSASYMGV